VEQSAEELEEELGEAEEADELDEDSDFLALRFFLGWPASGAWP
jgi:hypothetical protein